MLPTQIRHGAINTINMGPSLHPRVLRFFLKIVRSWRTRHNLIRILGRKFSLIVWSPLRKKDSGKFANLKRISAISSHVTSKIRRSVGSRVQKRVVKRVKYPFLTQKRPKKGYNLVITLRWRLWWMRMPRLLYHFGPKSRLTRFSAARANDSAHGLLGVLNK